MDTPFDEAYDEKNGTYEEYLQLLAIWEWIQKEKELYKQEKELLKKARDILAQMG